MENQQQQKTEDQPEDMSTGSSSGSPEPLTPAWSFGGFDDSSSTEIILANLAQSIPQSEPSDEAQSEQVKSILNNDLNVEPDTWDSYLPPVPQPEPETILNTQPQRESAIASAVPTTEPLDLQTDLLNTQSTSGVPLSIIETELEKPSVTASAPPVRTDYTKQEVVIEFENVTKSFHNQMVLRNLSFKIHKGETVCLIGESGCGKTVNLKLMIGLIKPDKGEVRFKDQSLARMNEKQITSTRIKFGFLFQMAALFDSMSIYDNVAFGLREHRLMPASEMPAYIRERLAEVGLPQGVELKKPAELSGGQRKRVGLARALALKPEVMLYDEPTTGLDPIMTDIINELILQTQNHGERSGIIVTHEMRTVIKCADRVIMLYPISRLKPDENQILYDGPPEGLERSPDPRVRQFVLGEAGDRIREMSMVRLAEETDSGVVPMDPDDIVAVRPTKTSN